MKHYGTEVISGSVSVIDCEMCGFKHILPLPTPEDLALHYESKFYETSKPDYRQSHDRDQDWHEMTVRMRLATIHRFAPQASSILDIGSGFGTFIAVAHSQDWEVLGVEPSASAAREANLLGRPTFEGTIEDYSNLATPRRFDAIHLRHVLEHVLDPATLLEQCKSLLNHAGVLCIEVPNDFSLVQGKVGDSVKRPNWWVAPPEHLNYFSPVSLVALLEREGFSVRMAHGTFPIDLALAMGFDYTMSQSIGRRCHELRKQIEVSLVDLIGAEGLVSLYSHLLELGLAREIVVFASPSSSDVGDV